MSANEIQPLDGGLRAETAGGRIGNIPPEELPDFLVPPDRLAQARFMIDGIVEFIGDQQSRLSCAGFVLRRYSEDNNMVNSLQHPPFRVAQRQDRLWQATSLIETPGGRIYNEFHYYPEKSADQPRSGRAHKWTGLEWEKAPKIIRMISRVAN